MAVVPVTAYVPAYNASEFLVSCVEGILAQVDQPDQIIVVDDGSRDSTRDICGRYPRITLIRHERNLGLGAARNSAFRAARNELVASVDADCVPDPHWLAGLLARMGDDRVAGVGGRLIEGVQRSVADRWRRAHMPQEWGDAPIRNPKFLFGCNTLLRKSAVFGVGGYDERMRTNGEDTGLSARLREAGWDLIYDPAAQATHLRHDSIRSILDTYWRWWKFGVNAYANGVRLRSVIGHALFVHFRHTFLGLVKSDLRARRFDLLGMDILALMYFPYRDLRMWLGAVSSTDARSISSSEA